MSLKETQEKIVANMSRWQKIEKASVESTKAVIEKTGNPLVQLVMEIIQRDSEMHHRVQEFIANSLESAAVSLSPDELAEVWDLIEKHIQIENDTTKLAKLSLEATQGNKGMQIQHYLIDYLLQDETKHENLLEKLEAFKKGMYPYA